MTNAERQAQHRERLKARNSMMEAIILKTRRDLREWRRGIALIESGYMRLHSNGADISDDQVATLTRIIHENEALVTRFDPECALKDDDIELGDVPVQMASQIWRGRPVTYKLDNEGRACDLSVFDSIEHAQSQARANDGRFSGWIGDESWSVSRSPRGS